ncbi:calcium-activated potassium channel, partial [Clonorchis sinensis]
MSTEYNFTSPIDCEKNALEVFGCSAAVYLIGVVTLVIVRFVHLRRKKDSEDEDSLDDLIRTRQMRWLPKKAESLLTGKPILGKILVSNRFALIRFPQILIRSALYTTCSVIYVVNTYRLTKITETLVLLHLIDDERSIRKMKLVSKLLAAWFTLAGVILL